MKNRITKIYIPAATVALVAAFVGCTPTRYVDPEGDETIISVNTVDIQDFAMAADSLVLQMLARDAFAGEKKPRVMLSLVKNDTTQNFDVALLTDKVQQKILESGKATVSMSMSVERNDDVVRNDLARMGQTELRQPDLTLLGKISEVKTRAGSTRQVSYVFSLRLADAKTGDLVWMGEKTLTKQGSKNAVGW